jgi:MFS family permease
MTSISTQYWHILLGQAFCIGLGAGCLVVPGLALLPQYFSKKRALVTGITVVGSSLGGVIYSLLFQSLAPSVGFSWTNRIFGFISLSTCSFALAVMRLRAKPRQVRSLVDPTAFREWPYIFYCIAMFFSNLGFFVPIFYLQTYALSHGLTDENLALRLVAILNMASILGRLVPSYFVVRIGPINTMMTVAVMASVVTCSWTAVNTGPANIVFAVMYGFTSGGIVSLPAVVLTSITSDISFLGARMGTSGFFNAIASLCGAPIAGAILNTTGSYLGIQLFAGFTILVTTFALYGARVSRAGTQLAVKV